MSDTRVNILWSAVARGGFSFLLPGLLCLLAACDNTVDPVTRDGDPLFYVYGYLDTAADTQFVRIEPVRDDTSTAGEINASVSIREMETGAMFRMADSLVVLDDGRRGHLFFAVFRPSDGSSYELTIVPPSGTPARAVTRIPDPPLFAFAPPALVGKNLQQRLTWSELSILPENIVLVYRVASQSQTAPVDVEIPYTSRAPVQQRNWNLDINLTGDRQTIQSVLDPAPDDTVVSLFNLSVRIRNVSQEWGLPEGSSNVENGLGFFGSVGENVYSWKLESHVLNTLNLRDRQDP